MNPMNKLRFITITGADDSIKATDLFKLTREFPMAEIEWAILVSKRSIGHNRFPSMQWLNDLVVANEINNEPFTELNLSLHLCGYYVRQLLMGNDKFTRELGGDVMKLFKRVQINTHRDPHEWNLPALADYIRANETKEFIFQIDGDGKNEAMAKILPFDFNLKNVSFLVDGSHGAGVLPGHWPMPQLAGFSTGYAGGLGPDNLEAEVAKISKAVATRTDFTADWWIDMETNVRSDQDRQFDLDKVRRVLTIAQPWFLEQQ
jgi:hypothetical protein